MRRRQTEFFQATVFSARTLLLVGLQVFTEQVKSRRNAQINHYHVRGLGQVVPYRRGGGGDIVLRQTRAVVGHVNGERLVLRLLVPGKEVTPHHLIRETSLAFKADFHGVAAFGVFVTGH